jgi:hypothetical protein
MYAQPVKNKLDVPERLVVVRPETCGLAVTVASSADDHLRVRTQEFYNCGMFKRREKVVG